MAAKTIASLAAATAILGDELLELSQVSSTVRITATTISAQASDNSFNDSASGFIAAGFQVGMRVQVLGFSGSLLNNIDVALITALTASKITIGGTDGDVIVDDAAGETVTISAWTSKRSSVDLIKAGGAGNAGATANQALVHLIGNTSPYFDKGYNIASVSRTGTGRYRVNFTTPFADTKYVVVGGGQFEFFADNNYPDIGVDRQGTKSTTYCDIIITEHGNTNVTDIPVQIWFQQFSEASGTGGGAKQIVDLSLPTALTGRERFEVAQPSTTIIRTATTLSALASDNSFNDSANGFLTGGFTVGDRVTVSGFTNAVNNIVVGVITALTAGKMTLGGVDGDVIVTESAGATVSIAKWVSRQVSLKEIQNTLPQRIGMFATTTPTSSEVLLLYCAPNALTFPANFVGSRGAIATGGANPTTSFVMAVFNNATQIGTITVSTSGVFTFATTSGLAQNVAAGNVIRIVGPATVDATIANFAATLLGNLT